MFALRCPNKLANGEYCNGLIGFVDIGTKNWHYVSAPCQRTYEIGKKRQKCGAMTEVNINEFGDLHMKVFRDHINAPDYPCIAEGVYVKHASSNNQIRNSGW